ncbi:hypothetical protein AAE478_009095 [Parahypoxylon ruwenzoriense]
MSTILTPFIDVFKRMAELSDEWTKVHRKGRSRRRAHRRATPSSPNNTTPTPPPRSSALSVTDLEREHRRVADQWKTSVCCRQLEEIVASRTHQYKISHAICFGLGSFDPDDGSWEGKRRAHVQLAAFLHIVEQLRRGNSPVIRCLFQEPLFNSVDTAFIRNLGCEVVDSPQGFELVSASTFVFGIHLYRDVYSQAIAKHTPAVFIGTPYDIWEECHGSPDINWAKMKDLSERCDKVKFPEDLGDTAFSSTAIHWRRQDEE